MEADWGFRCVCGGGALVNRVHAGRLVKCARCRSVVRVPAVEGNLATEPDFHIRTGRLDLRPANVADWRELEPILGDEPSHAFELSAPHRGRDLRRWLRGRRFPRMLGKSGECCLIVSQRVDEDRVGVVHLTLGDGFMTGSLGFMIHPGFRRRGYGQESVSGVVGYAFETLGLMTVSAMCDVRNEACLGLLGKLGFEREGLLRRCVRHAERGWIDVACHAIHHPTRED